LEVGVNRPIYQHRDFMLASIQEIRDLLDAADALGDGVEETPMTMREGYAQWAPWYGEPGQRNRRHRASVARTRSDGTSATSPSGAGWRATTSPPRFRPASTFAAARSSDGGPRSSTRQEGTFTIPTRPNTGREDPPATWALHQFAPEATNAAYRGLPLVIVWHFQLATA
jgi:hypothetical protein